MASGTMDPVVPPRFKHDREEEEEGKKRVEVLLGRKRGAFESLVS